MFCHNFCGSCFELFSRNLLNNKNFPTRECSLVLRRLHDVMWTTTVHRHAPCCVGVPAVALDILLNFVTSFYDKDGVLVTHFQQIRHKYLRGW